MYFHHVQEQSKYIKSHLEFSKRKRRLVYFCLEKKRFQAFYLKECLKRFRGQTFQVLAKNEDLLDC